MSRNPGGKQRPPEPDKRIDFELDDDQSAQIREAIKLDNAEDDLAKAKHTEAAWRQLAGSIGFDFGTLIIAALPESGPIKIRAERADIEQPGDQPTPEVEAGQSDGPAIEGDDDAEDEDDDDSIEASAGIRKMGAAAENMDLDSSTLVGDLTSGLLNIVQNLQKPWSAHSQHEKRDLVAKIEHIAKTVARQAVDVVAADDRITVKAILEKITIGDKVQIGLKLGAMPEEEQAEAVASLFHAQKKSVLIVTADADRHMGKRREHLPPDEEELPFDAGTDPKPAAQQQGDAAAQAALDAGSDPGDAEALGTVVEAHVDDALAGGDGEVAIEGDPPASDA